MSTPPKQIPAPKNTAYTMQRRLVSAKSHEFELISDFTKNGYRNREDITILPPGILVTGSYNVLTDVYGRVDVVSGYTLDGNNISGTSPITSSYDFTKLEDNDTHVRTHDGQMEVRYVSPIDGHVFWIPFFTSLASGNTVNYATYWDSVQESTKLLFVNQSSNIYEWSGAVGSILSTTSTSMTLEGSLTWAQLGFDEPGVYLNADTIVFTPGTGIIGQIASLSSAPTYGGTRYVVGDILNIIGGGGNGAQCVVAAVSAGVVTSVSLRSQGSNYVTTTSAATNGGTGTGCTVNIQSVTTNTVAPTISDPVNAGFASHNIGTGSVITVTGSSSNNGTYTVVDATASTLTLSLNANLTSETALVNIVALPSVIVEGTSYTYSGGVNTTTLTGMTGVINYVAGTGVTQTVETFSNSVTNGISPSFRNDLIANLDNQIFVGSIKSSIIYTSNVNNFLDYTYDLPRLVGQGWQATVAGYPFAFVNQEDDLYVSVGKDLWYKTQFNQTTDTTTIGDTTTGTSVAIVYETLQYQQLKVTQQQGAQSQSAITKITNDIAYLSFEPHINTLGRVDNILLTPQIDNLSYSIVNDMNAYNFENACAIYYKQFLYLSVPEEGVVRIYNMTQPKIQYWEAPITYPIAFFSIIDDVLYGHGYNTTNTYKLFDGYTFNGSAISAQALFSYNQYGTRFYPKVFNLFYLEGYIGDDCTLNFGFNYDIDGCMTQKVYQLSSATNKKQVCSLKGDASIGKSSIGERPLSGLINSKANTSNTGLPPKFRGIKQVSEKPFYEMQVFFASSGTGPQWSLVSCGPNAKPASEGTNSIQF